MNNRKLTYILCISILSVVLLYICDQILMINYNNKAIIKIILFSAFPLGYSFLTGESIIRSSIRNSISKKRDNNRKLSFILGISVFVIIICVYTLVDNFIDINTIIAEIENKNKISKTNFIYYSMYITFINSLLEEFFFRGFVFLSIKKLGYKKIAYTFSSVLFAIYHIAYFQNWFSTGIFLLAILGLVIGGCIFNYLDDRQETFLNSWFVHICADLGIILIGYKLFGII